MNMVLNVTGKIRFVALLCVILACSWSQSSALMSQYRMTVTTGSALSGGQNTIWQGYSGSRWNYGDWSYYGPLDLPFNFVFDGVEYNQMSIYQSGMVTLGPDVNYNPSYNTLDGTSVPTIAAWWADMFITGCRHCQTAQVSYSFLGSAPNRIVVIDWQHVETAFYEIWATMQIRLYENGTIEFWYGALNEGCGYTYEPYTNASIGLSTGSNNFVSVTPLASGGGASLSSETANNSVNMSETLIPSGTLYIFKQIPNVQLGVFPQPHVYDFGGKVTGSTSYSDITVMHVGSEGRLSIKSVTITGDPDFTVSAAPSSSDSLDLNETRPVTIQFAPTVDGPRSATVTIVSNGVDSGTQTFVVKGIGLAPLISVDTNILFKNKFTKLDADLTQRVIITSTNLPTLTISSFQFVGLDAGEYAVARYPSSMLIPGGQSDSVFVSYHPTKEGRHVATMNIINNSINNPVLPITLYGTGILPHITVTPRPIQFDSVAIGQTVCQDVVIRNPGTDTLLILKNLLTSNDGDFSYVGLTGTDTIIPPDKSKTLSICFTPKQKGSRIGRVTLSTNIPKTFEAVPRDTASLFNIDLAGAGVPYGVLSQSLSGLEGQGFVDSTLIGTSVCTTDTITNNGDADLTITSLAIAGSNASEFTVSGITTPFVIKAHSSVVVNVCGTPTTRGLRLAKLTITATSNGKAISSTSDLNIFGLQVCALSMPGDLFNPALLYKGQDSTECVWVHNCGDVAAVYHTSISGNNAADYSIAPQNSALVKPGDSVQFCVNYKPTAEGTSPATLSFTAPDLSPLAVSLNGSAGCAHLNTLITVADKVYADGNYPVTVIITNSGTYPWTPGTPTVAGTDPASITNISNPVVIAPGANAQVTMNFHPTQLDHQYTLTISFPGGPCSDSTATAVLDRHTDPLIKVEPATEQSGYSLGQNHPNPFSSSSEFTFTMPKESMVTIAIRDVSGKLVKTLLSGRVSSGDHTMTLDGDNLASGTYMITLETETIHLVRSVMIVK